MCTLHIRLQIRLIIWIPGLVCRLELPEYLLTCLHLHSKVQICRVAAATPTFKEIHLITGIWRIQKFGTLIWLGTVVLIWESKWLALWSKWPTFNLIFYNIEIPPCFRPLSSTLPLTGTLKWNSMNIYLNWYRNYERLNFNIYFILRKFQSFELTFHIKSG